MHDVEYRDSATGFHTNDIESENNRLKQGNRHRYGKLNLSAAELDEYCFYVNVGSEIKPVLEGLAISNGGVIKNKLI